MSMTNHWSFWSIRHLSPKLTQFLSFLTVKGVRWTLNSVRVGIHMWHVEQPCFLLSGSAFRSEPEASSRTSISPTQWFDLPPIRQNTHTGREQTCSKWHAWCSHNALPLLVEVLRFQIEWTLHKLGCSRVIFQQQVKQWIVEHSTFHTLGVGGSSAG